MLLTPFFEKQVKRDKEKQKRSAIGRLKKDEKGGQHDSPMVKGVQLYQTERRVKPIGRWSTKGSADRENGGGNQGYTPE
jgi:hypothetical protein